MAQKTVEQEMGGEADRYNNCLSLEIVDIFVGPKQTHFRVHKNLLCTKSEYFKKMFSGGFKEVVESTVRMPEDDSDAFDMFVQWLYKARLDPPDMAKHTPESGPLFNRHKLYCFAEKICSTDLMDYTISSIMSNYAKFNRLASTDVMTLAYKGTSQGSKLRLFIAHQLHHVIRIYNDKGPWPSTKLGQIMAANEDLTVDVLGMMRSQSDAPSDPAKLHKCKFHVHAKEHQCRYKDDIP